MAKIETLAAYKCSFKYMQRKNPLHEELREKIKAGIAPDYSVVEFMNDFNKYTATLAIGKSTERAIFLPEENMFERENQGETIRWRIAPYAGKQGKPFKIIKRSTGKKYDFGSDGAALYEHNVFLYQNGKDLIAIFHRQSGSGCKSVFLEVANNMLKEKGIKLEMELYLPLLPADEEVTPTRIRLQYIRDKTSSDDCENTHGTKKREIIQKLGLNLESAENHHIRKIIENVQLKRIGLDVAFAQIQAECERGNIYNDAEVRLRIGKRYQKVSWDELETAIGEYDITEPLHEKFKNSGKFIQSLTELTDEYYDSIVAEEAGNNECSNMGCNYCCYHMRYAIWKSESLALACIQGAAFNI